MTHSQIVFIVWLATIIIVSFLVLSVAPTLARTLFRERIDAIADDCQDALLDDRLTESPAVAEFLADLAMLKQVARQLTLHRVAMIVTALKSIGVDFNEHHSSSFAQLSQHERKILHTLMGRTNHALASYLLWGSPLAWVVAPFAIIVMRTKKPRRSRRRSTGGLPPFDIEKVAAQFNQAGAVNELQPRRRLHQVA